MAIAGKRKRKVEAGLTLFVAVDGNDKATGRSEKAALATLDGARDRIREYKRKNGGKMKGAARVWLLGGTYEMQRPLVLGPEDSGEAKAPITYGAYPGERVVLTGGRRIAAWREVQHKGKRCWVADLPEVKKGKWWFTQLFIGGERRPRTRLPKEGYYRFAHVDPLKQKSDLPAGSAYFHAGDLKNWKNLRDVKVTAIRHWIDIHLPVEAVDEDRGVVAFTPKKMPSLADESGHAARYWVENVFEALEEEGQWYLDRGEGRLYYLPRAHERMEAVEAYAPTLEHLIKLEGSVEHDGAKVRHVRFENLGLRCAEWHLPRENWGAGQAQFFFPGAVMFQGAEHCALYGCEITNVNAYAVEVKRGSKHNRIIACTMHDIGAGGVKVNNETLLRPWQGIGTDGFVGLDLEAMGWGGKDLPAEVMTGSYTTVSDCEIHAVGRLYPSCCAVWIGESSRNRVRHNHIYDTFYTAVSLGWNWGYMHTRVADNRVEYNYIHDIGQGKLSDMGCIYLLGIQPGTRIANNVLHDVNAYGYGGGGIYPDEGTSYVTIENNIVSRCDPLGQHYGRDNVVRNNIFANAHGIHVINTRGERYRPYIFEHNIVYGRKPFFGGVVNRVAFDWNVYFNPGEAEPSFSGMTFEQWRRTGQDAGAVLADPLFVDAEGGNFTLRGDSPALGVGFVPIDTSKVGPRFKGGERPLSLDDWPEEKEEPKAIVEARLEFGTAADYLTPTEIRDFPVRYVDVSEPCNCTLMIRNAGDVPASGTIEVSLRHGDGKGKGSAGKIKGLGEGNLVRYQLQPNQRKSVDFVVEKKAGLMHVILECEPRGAGTVPTALHLTARPVMKMKRFKGEVALGQVAKKLAGEQAFTGHLAPAGVAEMRFGMTATHLLVHAKIRDTLLRRGGAPWDGSCVEIFAASPGENGRTGNAQLFLLPPAGGKEAMGMALYERMQAAPEMEIETKMVKEGYELAARIPLATARLREGLMKFPFEAYATVVQKGQGTYSKFCLFGDANGTDNGGWAMAEVEEE